MMIECAEGRGKWWSVDKGRVIGYCTDVSHHHQEIPMMDMMIKKKERTHKKNEEEEKKMACGMLWQSWWWSFSQYWVRSGSMDAPLSLCYYSRGVIPRAPSMRNIDLESWMWMSSGASLENVYYIFLSFRFVSIFTEASHLSMSAASAPSILHISTYYRPKPSPLIQAGLQEVLQSSIIRRGWSSCTPPVTRRWPKSLHYRKSHCIARYVLPTPPITQLWTCLFPLFVSGTGVCSVNCFYNWATTAWTAFIRGWMGVTWGMVVVQCWHRSVCVCVCVHQCCGSLTWGSKML